MSHRSARATVRGTPALPGRAHRARIRPARAGAAVPPAESAPLGIATFLALLPPPAQGLTVDVACGAGLLGHHLARAGHTPLVGVAASRDHLLKASTRGCYDRLFVAPPTGILLPAGSAALVICFATWMGLDNLDQQIAEAVRLLRPGGHLAAAVLDPGPPGDGSLAPQLHAAVMPNRAGTLLLQAWHFDSVAYVAALERAGLLVEPAQSNRPWLYLLAERPRYPRS